jgi:vacuolar protein sorting-associated protein 13D
VYSEDPLWPALTLVGTLPKLTFHLNESKMATLRSVFSAFSSKQHTLLHESFDMSFYSGSQINILEAEKSEYKLNETLTTNLPKSISKLFVAEFTINSVSVDLQLRGRNIAELQIVGTKTVLTHRKDNTEFSFVIQSLLLADAVQTFGPDFQLLLASHRHVW